MADLIPKNEYYIKTAFYAAKDSLHEQGVW